MTDYIFQIVLIIVTGFIGVATHAVKNYLYQKGHEKTLNIAEIIARNAVNAVEQVAGEDEKGTAKFDDAKERVKKGLEAYNIYLTNSEIDTFIESAVKEMNRVWKEEETNK